MTIPLSENVGSVGFILGCLVLFIGSAMAAGGGLGGGGIFVPVLILIVGFDAKVAVPLSQAMIFGGSLVNLYINYHGRHPIKTHRPLIDYNCVLILEPLMLVGTTVGVIMNKIFPSVVIVIVLVITIGYGAIRTTKKGFRVWKKEKDAKAAEKRMGEADQTAEMGVEMSSLDDNLVSNSPKSEETETVLIDSRVQALYEQEADQKRPLLKIFVIFVLIVILSLLKGGKGESILGFKGCSAGYWGLTAFSFVVFLALAGYFSADLAKQHEQKVAMGYDFVEGDIEWTGRNVRLYPLLSAFAGICGGLLGIGGGMIMGPLLLELGMLPTNTQATSATTVMITSGAAMFQFLFLGMLVTDYAIVFSIIGFVATFIGQTFLNYLVKKYNTTSFIVFSIAIVMILAVIMMTIAGVKNIIAEAEAGELGMSSLC